MAKATLKIDVLNLNEVKRSIGALVDEIRALRVERDRLMAERDEWEERYERLLGEVGGTAPR